MTDLGVGSAAPRRRQKHAVGSQRGRQRAEIAANKLDAVGDAVDARIVTRELQTQRVDFDRNHALAREGELSPGGYEVNK